VVAGSGCQRREFRESGKRSPIRAARGLRHCRPRRAFVEPRANLIGAADRPIFLASAPMILYMRSISIA